MASPVAHIISADVGVTPEQSRVQALFSDVANDDKPVDDDEQTNLMQTSIPIDEELAHDKQDSTFTDVPTGRHGSAARLQPTDVHVVRPPTLAKLGVGLRNVA